MNNTVILIVAMLLVLLVVGGVLLAVNNKPKTKLVLGAPYDHVLNRKGLMKLVKDKNVPLIDSSNLLLPDALPTMNPEILAKVSVNTLKDTASLASSVVFSMAIDLEHLKVLSPPQIMAMSPFQLSIIDAIYGGADGQFSALAPLVSAEQLSAVKSLFDQLTMSS